MIHDEVKRETDGDDEARITNSAACSTGTTRRPPDSGAALLMPCSPGEGLDASAFPTVITPGRQRSPRRERLHLRVKASYAPGP
jgi:hypothetical protein